MKTKRCMLTFGKYDISQCLNSLSGKGYEIDWLPKERVVQGDPHGSFESVPAILVGNVDLWSAIY